MVPFILRRIGASVLVLLGAAFIMYVLTAESGDPLEDLRQSRLPNREALIHARTSALMLNVPAPFRFFLWLGGAAKCIIPFANSCDLGVTVQGQHVTEVLPHALGATVQLVSAATFLAILLGVTVGIASALRQYSGFDYSVTLISFLLYSLPAFWAAVLLKEFLAIGFNNFLAAPQIPPWLLIVLALVAGLIWMTILGGSVRRRWVVFGSATLATGLVLLYMSLTDWFRFPGLGPLVIAILSAAVAVAVSGLIAGLKNRRALIVAFSNAAIAVICSIVLQPLFNISSIGTLVFLVVIAIVVGLASGFFAGGPDRGVSMRVGALVALLTSGLVLLDRFMKAWPVYSDYTSGRPLSTVGSQTPNFDGDVWTTGLDSFGHLLLPTISLTLISFAAYTRYSRSGMLDVLSQDYIRTARAKGMPERVVIVRHAFRNSLIPISTIVASDIGAILGGAVITEQVFAFSGMGALFQAGLSRVDPNPVMAYFLVIAVMAILFNFIADMTYSALDPRVRTR